MTSPNPLRNLLLLVLEFLKRDGSSCVYLDTPGEGVRSVESVKRGALVTRLIGLVWMLKEKLHFLPVDFPLYRLS